MNARGQRAAAREAARQNQFDVLADPVPEPDGDLEDEDIQELPAAEPAAAAPMVVDPGIWLSMFNVKSPQLLDLEILSMKKFILDYKRYSQKCPPQLLRNIHHFILEEHLEIIVEFSGMRRRAIVGLAWDEFIHQMLQMYNASSSRMWRQMVKNAKMEKVDLTLSTFTQYVDDFKFWVAGKPLIMCLRKKWQKNRQWPQTRDFQRRDLISRL